MRIVLGASTSPPSWRDHLTTLLSLISVLAIVSLTDAAEPVTDRLVVALYPEQTDSTPGLLLVDQAVRAVFADDSRARVVVRNEYVDASLSRDEGFRQAQRDLLLRKYAGRKVDLVLAALGPGLNYALDHRDEIFPGASVVFFGVDQREVLDRKLPKDVIGIPTTMDLTATLDLALKLHPDTRRVAVVAGNATFDRFWGEEARRIFRPYEDRLEFESLTGLPMDDLLRRLAELPERTVIYYLHMFQDGTGKTFVSAEALQQVAARANVPIYGHADTYIGRGIVGGRVISLENEGRNAARLGLRILAGEIPEAIPVPEANENAYMFDECQLRRWGIRESSLPDGSVIRNQQRSFWDLYKWRIIGVFTLCIIEALLIFGLLLQRTKRLRADGWFQQVVETTPIGMLMVGRDGRIVMANAQTERLFGYSRQELLGQTIEMIVPERSRGRHPIDRGAYFSSPTVRPMGIGRNLFGRRKDGVEFPVEIGLSPLTTNQGVFVLASVIDLTERRRAEDAVLASQGELKLLTGRLLETQEVERRRIARELHDDINQTLALLAVEMDLLARTPPESAVRVAEKVQELADRVRQLSSAVHNLSHQLHPTKLEQLGLVLALQGLCKELTMSFGLEVTFAASAVPDTIPADAALCLYRIVQEGLRNVIKHGGTTRAAVELSGDAVAICLRIADDGKGFDPEAAGRNGGLGLVSMRERLNLVGGEVTIDSRPGGGTRIDVRIPLVKSTRPSSESATAPMWENEP